MNSCYETGLYEASSRDYYCKLQHCAEDNKRNYIHLVEVHILFHHDFGNCKEHIYAVLPTLASVFP